MPSLILHSRHNVVAIHKIYSNQKRSEKRQQTREDSRMKEDWRVITRTTDYVYRNSNISRTKILIVNNQINLAVQVKTRQHN